MKHLSPKQFRDALRKGLGRAVRHVRNSSPAVVRSDLAHACTRFLGLNLQEESGGRATWLFSMIEATGEFDFYRQQVVAAMEQMPDDPDDTETFNELFGLLTEFAKQGDAEALAVMRQRFDSANVQYEPHFGFYDLFQLDGVDALIRLLRREWKRIHNDEKLWVDDDEIKFAKEQLGKDTVQAALEKESAVDESVRLCLGRMREQQAARQAERVTRKGTKKKPIVLPRLRELIDDLDNDWPEETAWTDETFRNTFLRRRNLFLHAGRFYAMPTPEELEFAFQQLLETTDPGRQYCLLGIFLKATMPRLEPCLLSLFDAPYRPLRWGAEQAFSRMVGPVVREKGLELISKGPTFPDWYLGIGLLEQNFQPGDESLVEEKLKQFPSDFDAYEMDDVNRFLLDLIAAHPEHPFESLLLWNYENTFCPYCRCRSVEQMIQRNLAPNDLLDECLDDSYKRTRELARAVVRSSRQNQR